MTANFNTFSKNENDRICSFHSNFARFLKTKTTNLFENMSQKFVCFAIEQQTSDVSFASSSKIFESNDDVSRILHHIVFTIEIWKKTKLAFYQLWSSYEKKFENYIERDFKFVSNRQKRKFRDFLKQRGVWMKKESNITITKILFNALHEKNHFKWSATNFESRFRFEAVVWKQTSFWRFVRVISMIRLPQLDSGQSDNRQCIWSFQRSNTAFLTSTVRLFSVR